MAFIPPAQQGFRDRLAGVFSGAGSIFGNLQNSPGSTPDEVERQRQRAEMLNALAMGAGGQASSFAGALAQGLQGFAGGRLNKRSDIQQQAGLAGADAALASNPVLAALTGQDMQAPQGVQPMPITMPGNAPQEARATPGADAIRAGLVQRGLPPHVADAFVMNFQDESGLNPGINEQNPLVEGSRGGFGLYQLTGPRRVAYENFAAERGVDPADVDAQLDFLMMELQGPESAAAEAILSAPDTGSAAAAIVSQFLRPAEEHRARRVAEYTGGAGMPTSVAPAPTQAPSNVVAALASAAGDPWVQQKYGPVLDALMQQEMGRQDAAYSQQLEQSDPMYQAQLQQQQLQNQALMNPISEPVFQGGQWWDTSSGQPVPLTEAQAERTAAQQNFEFMISQGMDPQTAMDRAFSGGTTVNVGDGSPGLGKLSTDFGYVLDPATGQPLIDPATGLPTAAPVPGSPAARELERTAAQGSEKDRQQTLKMGTTLDSLALNIGEIEDGGLPMTGLVGSVLGGVPGTPQADFRNRTTQINTRAALDEVQNMRDNSPTGGAVGQLTDSEREAIGTAATAMNNSTSSTEYLRAAKAFRELMLNTALGEGTWSLTDDGGVVLNTEQPAAAGGIPEGIDAATWEFMTPEEKALWQ